MYDKLETALSNTALIEEIEVTGSPAASVTFDNIPQTFRELVIVARVASTKSSSALGPLTMTVGNGTVDTGASSYAWFAWRRDGANASTSANDTADALIQLDMAAVPGSGDGAYITGRFGGFEIRIPNYKEAEQRIVLTDARMMATTGTDRMVISYGIGYWGNTSDAIDIITIQPAAGDSLIVGSRLALYGIK